VAKVEGSQRGSFFLAFHLLFNYHFSSLITKGLKMNALSKKIVLILTTLCSSGTLAANTDNLGEEINQTIEVACELLQDEEMKERIIGLVDDAAVKAEENKLKAYEFKAKLKKSAQKIVDQL
jgi:hypothetical protein